MGWPLAGLLIARVSYEAEKAPPKRGCQVGGNAVPKRDQHWLAESSKCVQIDFAYIPMLSARSSAPWGVRQQNGFCRQQDGGATLSIFSICEVKGRGARTDPPSRTTQRYMLAGGDRTAWLAM